jgi:hypothetical protein
MLLLNRFWAYSDSWRVAVNSDVKHTMHGMGVHDMAVHDVGVDEVAVHGVAMSGVAVPGVGVHKTVNFSG